MEIPNGAKIFIIEGVPGSGKTIFHGQLMEELAASNVGITIG